MAVIIITELGQRLETQTKRLSDFEVMLGRINDTVRNVAVEVQPSHTDQKFHNINEEQKLKLDQWAKAFTESVNKDREADVTTFRQEIADQVEMSRNLLRQFKDQLDQQAQLIVSGSVEQEMVDRIMRLEDELKRRAKEMNRATKCE